MCLPPSKHKAIYRNGGGTQQWNKITASLTTHGPYPWTELNKTFTHFHNNLYKQLLQSLCIERRDEILLSFVSPVPGLKPDTKYMLSILNEHAGATVNLKYKSLHVTPLSQNLSVASISPRENFKVPLMTFKALHGLTLKAQFNFICLLVLYNSLILPQQDSPPHFWNSISMILFQDLRIYQLVLPWISAWLTSSLPGSHYSNVSLSSWPSMPTTYIIATPTLTPRHFLLLLTALFI